MEGMLWNCSLRSLTLSGFSLLLKVDLPEGGMKERLISGGGRLLARWGILNSTGDHCSREDWMSADSGKAAETRERRRAAVD